jgi:hypothetical protein
MSPGDALFTGQFTGRVMPLHYIRIDVMKFVIGVVVAAVAVVAGYLALTSPNDEQVAEVPSAEEIAVEVQEIAEEAPQTAVDEAVEAVQTAAEDAVEGAAEAVQEVAETAVEGAQEAAEAVAETVTETVTETVGEVAGDVASAAGEAATDAVSDSLAAVKGVVEGAGEVASDVAGDAVEAVTENAVVDAAKDMTGAVTEKAVAVGASAAELFTVEGFDFDKASDFIADSELNALAQVALTKGLETARDNPEMLSVALEKARMQLGL